MMPCSGDWEGLQGRRTAACDVDRNSALKESYDPRKRRATWTKKKSVSSRDEAKGEGR